MTITTNAAGSLVLDWKPPVGPFITLTPAQYAELLRTVMARERLYQ